MEVLVDYHLVFIVMSFVLLIMTVFLLFVEVTFERVIAGIVLAGLNGLTCLISAYSFFRIGITGFSGSGVGTVTVYEGMQVFFGLFMALNFLNAAFVLYGGMLLAKKPWEEIEKDKVAPTTMKI